MQKFSELLKHIIVPMVTPFKPDNQDVDYDAAGKVVEHLISNNYCDSILIAGTTGEFNTLQYDERVELFRVAKDAAGGRVPLLAGTGAASTREAVSLTQEAEKIG